MILETQLQYLKKKCFHIEERLNKSYVLSLTADYEMDFLYFRSVYESLEELNAQLEKFSCGTWK